jgi:hypothetical protein
VAIGDWTVTFTFNRQPRRVQTPFTEQWDFNDLKEGFWINAQLELCRERQGGIWIPPSQILMIERVGAETGSI